jgi:hypothetical protein
VFGRHEPEWKNHRLYVTRKVDGVWTEPELAPFSRGVDTSAAHFAPDGKSLLFVSSRSPSGGERVGEAREGNVWRVSWDGRNWGVPQMLPAPINGPDSYEIDAVEVNGGVIYFTTMGHGAEAARPDMFRAVPTATGYRVEPLREFNTEKVESTLFVTPDEQLIVFHRSDDPRGLGKDDLFAARRRPDGSWSPEVHLGAGTNSPEYEYGPEVSPDGTTLYFTTHRDGKVEIMAVDLKLAMGEYETGDGRIKPGFPVAVL